MPRRHSGSKVDSTRGEVNWTRRKRAGERTNPVLRGAYVRPAQGAPPRAELAEETSRDRARRTTGLDRLHRGAIVYCRTPEGPASGGEDDRVRKPCISRDPRKGVNRGDDAGSAGPSTEAAEVREGIEVGKRESGGGGASSRLGRSRRWPRCWSACRWAKRSNRFDDMKAAGGDLNRRDAGGGPVRLAALQ